VSAVGIACSSSNGRSWVYRRTISESFHPPSVEMSYNGFQNYVLRIGDRFRAAGGEHWDGPRLPPIPEVFGRVASAAQFSRFEQSDAQTAGHRESRGS